MIDVIVSPNGCPHCAEQRAVMVKSFFNDEYNIIAVGSAEFEALSDEVKDQVDGVPFVIVKEGNEVKYARKGLVDGTTLRQIERLGAPAETVFNLKESRRELAVAWAD